MKEWTCPQAGCNLPLADHLVTLADEFHKAHPRAVEPKRKKGKTK